MIAARSFRCSLGRPFGDQIFEFLATERAYFLVNLSWTHERRPDAVDDDQERTAAPDEAMAKGADLLVIGRPITRAADPGMAAAAIHAAIMGSDARLR